MLCFHGHLYIYFIYFKLVETRFVETRNRLLHTYVLPTGKHEKTHLLNIYSRTIPYFIFYNSSSTDIIFHINIYTFSRTANRMDCISFIYVYIYVYNDKIKINIHYHRDENKIRAFFIFLNFKTG